MLTTVKIVGFIDADGQQQLSLIRYPTEVIFLEGRAHRDDDTADKCGRVDFHNEATQLPLWCSDHWMTYVHNEVAVILNEGYDG